MLEINNPEHIAIILDGNRRFAKRLMLQPWKGHEYGRKKVEDLLNYSKDFGIKELTFYCLSCENIKTRPEKELDYLFDLFIKTFSEMDKEKLLSEGVQLKFIGDLKLLPLELQNICKELEEISLNGEKFIINFALAYGGRQEILDAVKNIVESGICVESINEKLIKENLWLKNEPDLIIRTGGEKRTSNFLPWQSAYSEWIFLNKMWPEFNKGDLVECIEEFKKRKRNFGG